DQGAHATARLRQPLVRLGRVGDRESGEMHAAIAPHRMVQLLGEFCIRRLEQRLDIAARQHGGDVAGAGRLRRTARGVRIELDGFRRRCESGPRQRAARGLRVAHEMADMVEKNLVSDGELAICMGHAATYVFCSGRTSKDAGTLAQLVLRSPDMTSATDMRAETTAEAPVAYPARAGAPRAAVSFVDVTKHFPAAGGGRLEVLRAVSFDVPLGEIVAIVGPSGAGGEVQ